MGKLRHLETHALWLQEKVRTWAIEVRKVRVDVNPADLFTKHPSVQGQDSLVLQVFCCEYRPGRSEAAPLLRPQGSSGGKGGQPATGHLPAFTVLPEVFISTDGEEDNQEPHDPSVLPHLYVQRDRDRLFPLILAPLRGPNDDDWSPEISEKV